MDSSISRPDGPGKRTRHLCFVLGIVALTALRLWLIGGQCRIAVTDKLHDDRLFVDLAVHLLEGGWLGPYDALSLAKGPVYPMWLAGGALAAVPSYLAQHLLYAAACALFVTAIGPLVRSLALRTVVYAFLLFNPATCAGVMLTYSRETIYGSLLVLTVAGAIGTFCRTDPRPGAAAGWGLILGLALSLLWLTREEAVEVVPAVIVAALYGAWRLWRRRPPGWRWAAAAFALPFAVWGGSVLAICTVNLRHYGIFTSNEFRTHAFRSAYGALGRVEHARWRRLVPVPQETRERIYAVSPAFAELRPFLEGPLGRGWARISSYQFEDGATHEIGAGYFMWALRDAVELAGHCADGRTAMGYYRRLADEVNTACDEGRLVGGRRRATMMPPWRREYVAPVARAMARNLLMLVTWEGCRPPMTVRSTGDVGGLALFEIVSGDCVAPLAGGGAPDSTVAQDPLRVFLLTSVWRVYRAAGPVLGVLALVAFAVAWGRRARGGTAPGLGAATVVLVVLLSRYGLVCLITAIALPSILQRYLAPGWYLLPPVMALALLTVLGARGVDQAGPVRGCWASLSRWWRSRTTRR